MPAREVALTRKLADTFHLSATERAELPSAKLRGSLLVHAIGEILSEYGWYPKDWRPDQPYSGIIIEAQASELLLHERIEVGIGRFSDVRSIPARTLEDAVRSLVDNMFGSEIDGVRIDWTT